MAFEKIEYASGDVLTAEQMNKIQDAVKTNEGNIESHIDLINNPHNVTKSQVGLGNVPNVATDDQTPTFTEASDLETLTSGEKLSVLFGKITKAISSLISHIGNKSNPHGVTASQVGAAESSHNHSTSNITSGTLGVARGGTGATTHTSNAILTGNGTSAVNNVATASGAFYATSANGAAKFGTLPVAQGGTGMTGASTSSANNSYFTAYCAKFGNLVVCTLSPKVSVDTMIYTSEITIPSGYRPSKTWTYSIFTYHNKNNGGSGTISVTVNSAGTLSASHGNGLHVEDACRTYCWTV